MATTWERNKNASIISLHRQLDKLRESTQHNIAQVGTDNDTSDAAAGVPPSHTMRPRGAEVVCSSPAKYYPGRTCKPPAFLAEA